MDLLVGIPVYGQQQYTHDLIPDLRRENVDFLIIDNRGDYEPLGDERVLTPGRNTGWAGASNLAFRTAFAEGYGAAMTMNNDVRLSPGYFAGITDARLPDDAGAVAAVYDDFRAHPAMVSDHTGPAAEYVPRDRYRELLAVDGTGLKLTRSAFIATGGLDERSFGRFAWGADLDLCMRLRAEGFRIVATERSFLNHFGGKTAQEMVGGFRYHFKSSRAMSRGLKQLHGRGWRKDAVTRRYQVRSLDDHGVIRTEAITLRGGTQTVENHSETAA